MITRLTIEQLVDKYPNILGTLDVETFINMLVPVYVDQELFDVYCKKDALHKTDVPAVINADSTEEWWANGKLLQEET